MAQTRQPANQIRKRAAPVPAQPDTSGAQAVIPAYPPVQPAPRPRRPEPTGTRVFRQGVSGASQPTRRIAIQDPLPRPANLMCRQELLPARPINTGATAPASLRHQAARHQRHALRVSTSATTLVLPSAAPATAIPITRPAAAAALKEPTGAEAPMPAFRTAPHAGHPVPVPAPRVSIGAPQPQVVNRAASPAPRPAI